MLSIYCSLMNQYNCIHCKHVLDIMLIHGTHVKAWHAWTPGVPVKSVSNVPIDLPPRHTAQKPTSLASANYKARNRARTSHYSEKTMNRTKLQYEYLLSRTFCLNIQVNAFICSKFKDIQAKGILAILFLRKKHNL